VAAAFVLSLLAAGQAWPQKGLPPRVDAMSIPLVEEVAPPSYPVGSIERGVFDTLNIARARGNFGLLAQDTRLDAAAAAHARYLALKPGHGLTHLESPDEPGFTGETPMARARAAGFSPATSLETLSTGTTVATCLELLNTVYHLSLATIGATHVGIGVHGRSGCVIGMHLPLRNRRMQARTGGTVGVYPYPDQEGVPTGFLPDTETPRPPLDARLREVGPPILVDLTSEDTGVLRASDIVISRFTLTEFASERPVAGIVLASVGVSSKAEAGLDHHADPAVVASGHVFLVPTRPLEPATIYVVDFEGSAKGITVGRRWRFTTR
jgi:uncharacterized protein YkwD